uniref:Uncharacterized protein n=1 Tax=Salix viminalis TaxID=40686 RepID=A0A6N2M3C2_SALVM
MITWAVKLAASLAGSSLEFEATKPRFRSFTATFLTLNPTLSPGRASRSASWCISTDLTSVFQHVPPGQFRYHQSCTHPEAGDGGACLRASWARKSGRGLPGELGPCTTADHLLHTKGEGKECVLTGLAILGDTSFKTTSGGINDENSTVSLGSSSNHVLDKVTMSRGINDSAVVLGGLKLPQGNINGDATLTLSLELVKHPGVLE